MNQLVTLEQAKAIAQRIGAEIGGGVLPFKADAVIENGLQPEVEDIDRTSGIYIPAYTTGPFPTPNESERQFYHFRFRNGADGINAGLVFEMMAYSPLRWPTQLALEVKAAARR